MKKIVILSIILILLLITKTVLATGLVVDGGRIWSGDSILIDGENILTKKPEVVTWGKMQSLAAKISDQNKKDMYFKFFDTDKIFLPGDLSENVFYIVSGKATINTDMTEVNGVVIAVNRDKNNSGKIEFESEGSDVIVNGILYSAGDIKLNGRNVTVNYKSDLFFNPDLKDVFTDFTDWKQGV